jgi:hypothetical protein
MQQFNALDSGTYPRLPAAVESYETCTDWRDAEAPPPCNKKRICPHGWQLVAKTYWDEASSSQKNCVEVANFAQIVDLPAFSGFTCDQLQFFYSMTDCCADFGKIPPNWHYFPTPAATNPPKPVYVAADFSAVTTATPVADSSIGTLTLAPTLAPTPAPTVEGYMVQEEQKSVAVVSATLSFPLTAAQAQDPVMMASIEGGVALSLGKSPSHVTITHIAGQQVSRRLVDAVELTFEIQSSSTVGTEVADLKADFEAAATEGSLVANVQEQAMQNGVLVAALQSMPREMATPTVTDSTKTMTVFVQARPEESAATVSVPDTNSRGGSKDTNTFDFKWLVLGIVGFAVLFASVIAIVDKRQTRDRANAPKYTQRGAVPHSTIVVPLSHPLPPTVPHSTIVVVPQRDDETKAPHC